MSFVIRVLTRTANAEDKSFTFSGLSPNAISDVTLIVEIHADVDSLTEYVTIFLVPFEFYWKVKEKDYPNHFVFEGTSNAGGKATERITIPDPMMIMHAR